MVTGDNSVTHLKQTSIFEWCMIMCGHQKDTYLRRNWTTCSIFVNHPKLKSQHNLSREGTDMSI